MFWRYGSSPSSQIFARLGFDPKHQIVQNLPRWEPKSCCGMFVSLSLAHAGDFLFAVTLVSVAITAKFHVVFDDLYATISSIGREDEKPPDHREHFS